MISGRDLILFVSNRIVATRFLSTNGISKRLMVVLMGEFYVPAMLMDFKLVKYYRNESTRMPAHVQAARICQWIRLGVVEGDLLIDLAFLKGRINTAPSFVKQ